MRILVTGGAGFIGSNFVRYLLEQTDDSVTTLDALTYAGDRANLDGVRSHPDHEFVEGDIRDQALVSELVADAACHFDGRGGITALVAANDLAGELEPAGELALGPSLLFAQFGDLFAQVHDGLLLSTPVDGVSQI